MKSPGTNLFDEIEGRGPGHANQKVSTDAALNAAPTDRSLAKHHEQDDTNVEKLRDDGENAAELLEEGRWEETRGPQYSGSDKDHRDGDDGDDSTLIHHQGAGNHQCDHHKIDEQSAGKAGLAQREDDENE